VKGYRTPDKKAGRKRGREVALLSSFPAVIQAVRTTRRNADGGIGAQSGKKE